jgi:hypothetical protein
MRPPLRSRPGGKKALDPLDQPLNSLGMEILESPKCIVTLCRGQIPWERGDRPADVNGALVALSWLDLGMIGAWAVDAPFYARNPLHTQFGHDMALDYNLPCQRRRSSDLHLLRTPCRQPV